MNAFGVHLRYSIRFSIVLLKNARPSLKRSNLFCCKACIYLSELCLSVIPFQTYKLPVALVVMYPIPSYMKVLKLRPDNKLDWPSPLKFDDDVYAFQKEFQIWLIWPVIHFAVLCCWEDCTVSGSCQHIALSLHDGALTYICGHKLCSQTLISGSVPKPMYWFPWQNHA